MISLIVEMIYYLGSDSRSFMISDLLSPAMALPLFQSTVYRAGQ
jgi:hypothetical protein